MNKVVISCGNVYLCLVPSHSSQEHKRQNA